MLNYFYTLPLFFIAEINENNVLDCRHCKCSSYETFITHSGISLVSHIS